MSGLVAACGGDQPASGEVVLYTSLPDAVVDRLEGVIEQRFPDLDGNVWLPIDSEGIFLTVVRGRTADIERRIAEEIGRGGIEADLIWLAEPSPYESYKDLNLLAPYEPPEEAPINSRYVDSDGYFVAARVISMTLAWNTELRTEGLTDWPELHDVGLVAFPSPESGAARATIKALTDEYGEGFFAALVDGGAVSVASNGAARDGVVEGTFEAVAVLDYMARAAKAAGANIDFTYPATGTVLIPSPVAVTADARNPKAALAVVDFILSQAGQKIIVEIGNFYPVRDDVDPPAGATPLDEIPTLEIDWSALPSQIESITRVWEDLFGLSVGYG